MHECRGLCLRSTATRKGDPSALASARDTSPRTMRGIGHPDKVPVCIQNMPDTEHSAPMCVVLPWPRGCLHPAYQEPDHNSGGRVATVSLRRNRLPVVIPNRGRTECLLTSARSIPTCNTSVNNDGASCLGFCKASVVATLAVARPIYCCYATY